MVCSEPGLDASGKKIKFCSLYQVLRESYQSTHRYSSRGLPWVHEVPRHETDIDRVQDGNSSTFTEKLVADPLDVCDDTSLGEVFTTMVEDDSDLYPEINTSAENFFIKCG